MDVPLRVLVAADELLRAVLAEALADEGHVPSLARNGPQVVGALGAALPPDVVLLEVGLPLLDPRAFVQAWRQAHLSRRVAVVLLTGMASVPDEFEELEPYRRLEAPFTLDAFLNAVRASAASRLPGPLLASAPPERMQRLAGRPASGAGVR